MHLRSKIECFDSKKLHSPDYAALTDDEKNERTSNTTGNFMTLMKVLTGYNNTMLWWDRYRSLGGPAGSRDWWLSFWVVMAAALYTRISSITSPYMVIWDEAHFGKMLSYYINGTFFFDVHPTGGKLLLTFFGWLGGYNGTHSFEKPGVSYEGYPEIMLIRFCCALMGALLAPIAFCSAWTMTRRIPAAVLAATFVVTEIGTLMLTKFILLDAPLMFFMMASLLAMCRLHYASQIDPSFGVRWWCYLILTGLMIGCVVSVKFVGLFMVAVVGLYTVQSLWDILAYASLVEMFYHIMARTMCLIILPIVIYMGCFIIHDSLLISNNAKQDPGEFHLSHFTPGFQMNIANTALHGISQPLVVTYGANTTIRSITRGGGFLSTMNNTYPSKHDPNQKQVVFSGRTKSFISLLQIRFPLDDPDLPDGYYSGDPEIVQHLDIVRLYSPWSNKFLACNKSQATVVTVHKLVYFEENVSEGSPPDNHMWQVQLITTNSPETLELRTNEDMNAQLINGTDQQVTEENEKVISWNVLESHVKLFNVYHKCYLSVSGKKLPKSWGLGQPEVSCGKSAHGDDSRWYVEQSFDRHVTNSTFGHLRTGLWSRFVETFHMMMWMWPLCYRSHPWYDETFRIVLLGNPIVFWFNIVGFIITVVFLSKTAYNRRRNPHLKLDQELCSLIFWCRWLLLAYLLHYLPFYTMNRILYFHHYFPALQISSLLTSVILGTLMCRLSRGPSLLIMIMLLLSLIYSFCLFSFTGYGEYPSDSWHAHNSTHRHLRWLDGWQLV
uniref:Protein O-mannosyl-transferase 2 n=1 Tax=Hirondellea gigas TaxID=1518452 RepID=A0A6A7G6J1_9CRUS